MEIEHRLYFIVFKNFKRKIIKRSENSPSLNNKIIVTHVNCEKKSAEKHH